LHDEAAGEGVQAKQRRKLEDDGPRGPQRRGGAGISAWLASRDLRVEEPARQAEERVEDEHGLDRGQLAEPERPHEVGGCRGERADRTCERSHQAVAGKHLCADGVSDLAGERRVLKRHEDADAAGGGIDRAGKCDDQEQCVIVDDREGDAGGDHQAGGGKQELAVIESDPEESDAYGQKR
jgi:hypothetical protein